MTSIKGVLNSNLYHLVQIHTSIQHVQIQIQASLFGQDLLYCIVC
nr:MAG TPA: hypothetical protein [Caudoviricetes sp.]